MSQEEKSPSQIDLEHRVEELRSDLEDVEKRIVDLKRHAYLMEPQRNQHAANETMRQIQISIERVEDLSMRLGLIFKALDGGVSVYKR